MIRHELDEIGVVYFIEDGKVDYGYEINKQSRWIKRFELAVIGIFEVIFEKRSYF